MSTEKDTGELKVINSDGVETDLKKWGVNVAAVVVLFDDRTRDGGETGTTSSSDGATSRVTVEFGEGDVISTMVLFPIQHTMSIQTGDLSDKKRKAIEKRAEDSKEVKERDGIGE